jgi:hypothetical protein
VAAVDAEDDADDEAGPASDEAGDRHPVPDGVRLAAGDTVRTDAVGRI